MAEVSVVTWNLHQGVDKRAENKAATWTYLTNEIRPTAALIQEADGVPQTPGGCLVERSEAVRYETAVVGYRGRVEPLPMVNSRYSKKHTFEIRPRVPANFAAARVLDIPGVEPFVAISLYGIMAPIYAQSGILRAVADLIPLFDSTALNRRIVRRRSQCL